MEFGVEPLWTPRIELGIVKISDNKKLYQKAEMKTLISVDQGKRSECHKLIFWFSLARLKADQFPKIRQLKTVKSPLGKQ